MCASTDVAKEQRPWASKDCPSLEPAPGDEFYIEVPGYDLRRLLLAQDPLCAANAFFVQVRVILATVLGIRMCPHCPHCARSSNPCQDGLGSGAEIMASGCSVRSCGMPEIQWQFAFPFLYIHTAATSVRHDERNCEEAGGETCGRR